MKKLHGASDSAADVFERQFSFFSETNNDYFFGRNLPQCRKCDTLPRFALPALIFQKFKKFSAQGAIKDGDGAIWLLSVKAEHN